MVRKKSNLGDFKSNLHISAASLTAICAKVSRAPTSSELRSAPRRLIGCFCAPDTGTIAYPHNGHCGRWMPLIGEGLGFEPRNKTVSRVTQRWYDCAAIANTGQNSTILCQKSSYFLTFKSSIRIYEFKNSD